MPDRRFDGLRLDETLDAKFALTLEHARSGENMESDSRRLAALNAAINENLVRDEVFLGFFDHFIQRVYDLPEHDHLIMNPLNIALAARDIIMERRDGDCLAWHVGDDLMLKGIDDEVKPRLRAVWGSLLWLHLMSHAQNFVFKLPQVMMTAGFSDAFAVSREIGADGESLWAVGRFGSGDEFAATEIGRRWRLSQADAAGGLAAKALMRDMSRALLSEMIKLSLYGGGAWRGLMPLARAEDTGGPRGEVLVVAERRFALGVDDLPAIWIKREGDGFATGITAQIGFCELSGSARL